MMVAVSLRVLEPLRAEEMVDSCPVRREQTTNIKLVVNLRKRTAEERRRQTLCDKSDNNLVENTFRQTSPSFKQIFL